MKMLNGLMEKGLIWWIKPKLQRVPPQQASPAAEVPAPLFSHQFSSFHTFHVVNLSFPITCRRYCCSVTVNLSLAVAATVTVVVVVIIFELSNKQVWVDGDLTHHLCADTAYVR